MNLAIRIAFAFLALILISSRAYAETLDEPSVRIVLGEIKNAARDPDKSESLLNKRLDENFALKTTVYRTVDGGAPKRFATNMTKAEAINATVKSLSNITIDKYSSSITSVSFSDDKQYAYVNDETSSTGEGKASTPSGDTAGITYEADETCSYVVALMHGVITIMQSQCDDQVRLTKKH